MAKRKRLTPPEPAEFDPAAGLETKAFTSYPQGVAPTRTFRAAPIAAVAAEASAAAAVEEMAETLRRARDEGRLVLTLPLDAIEAGYLVRDRIAVNDEEMEALKASLAARGQQTPIEVAALGQDRYGLISGWRRLSALRALQAEGGIGTVLALLRRPDDSAEAYLAMVEENEIRVGLSYYERARIAVKAVDQGVFDSSKAALLALFAAASRAKRSKIRSFLPIVTALDGALRFPEALGERLGLKLSQMLEQDPGLGERLRGQLRKAAPDSAEAEQAVISRALAPAAPAAPGAAPLEPRPGVILRQAKSGALTLSGPAVTAALRDDLVAWLRARG